MVLSVGFFAKSFAVIVGTLLGVVEALLGDVIRRFARPDFIYTNGGIVDETARFTPRYAGP